MFQGLVENPRPAPSRLRPMAAAGAVVLLALPVYALLGWSLKGWALGAVLWAASEAVGLLLGRITPGTDHLGASSAMGVGMMLRPIVVMVIVIAVAAHDKSVGLAAAGVYAVAYTLELGLSVSSYFSQPPKEVKEP